MAKKPKTGGFFQRLKSQSQEGESEESESSGHHEVVECEFSFIGCTEKFPLNERSLHMSRYAKQHRHYMEDVTLRLSRQMVEEKEKQMRREFSQQLLEKDRKTKLYAIFSLVILLVAVLLALNYRDTKHKGISAEETQQLIQQELQAFQLRNDENLQLKLQETLELKQAIELLSACEGRPSLQQVIAEGNTQNARNDKSLYELLYDTMVRMSEMRQQLTTEQQHSIATLESEQQHSIAALESKLKEEIANHGTGGRLNFILTIAAVIIPMLAFFYFCYVWPILHEVTAHKNVLLDEVNKNHNVLLHEVNAIYRDIAKLKRVAGVPPYEFELKNYSIQQGNVHSETFYTHERGYKCRFLIGVGGTHLSLGLLSVPGEFDAILPWPATATITIQLLNQCNDPDYNYLGFTKTFQWTKPARTQPFYKNDVYFVGTFSDTVMRRADITTKNYLKNDCLRFKIAQIEIHSIQA